MRRSLLITGCAAAAAVLAVATSGCGRVTAGARPASAHPSAVAPATVNPCTATAAYAAEVSDAGKAVWQTSLPPGQAMANLLPSPVVVGGIAVFAGVSDLTGLRASDGRRLWDFHIPHHDGLPRNFSQLWQWDGTVIALVGYSGTDWRVVAVDPATGKVRWQFKLATRVDVAPALSPDGVLAVAAGWNLYALRLSDGHLLWSRTLVKPELNGNNTDDVIITDGVVIAGYMLQDPVRNGFLAGFREQTGAQLWSRTGTPEVSTMRADGGTVFLWGASSGSGGRQQPQPLTALSAASGKTIWRASVGYVYSLWTAPGQVIFGSSSGMFDDNSATGATRWKVPGEANVPSGPSDLAITATDVLYYPTSNLNLIDRRLGDGTVAWTQPAAGKPPAVIVIPDGPNAQVAVSNNFDDAPLTRVYTVNLRTGKVTAPMTELPSDLPAVPAVVGGDVIYQLIPEPCERG